MVTRAQRLIDRSRALLGRSREVAAQFLAAPEPPPRHPLAAPPALTPDAQPETGPEYAQQHDPDTLAAVCANVALRDLNLVDSLLSQLEEMEAQEEDTERLAALYRLDHLATRLRRNAENLRVLAGRDVTHTTETTSFVDVVRAGMSAIEGYSRVTIGRVVSLGVVGFAAEDVGRLLAELLDNATKSSPPSSPVRVSAHLTEQGSVLMRIEDEGIGLPPERLKRLNERLSGSPVLDDETVRHMGLAVVHRLAARHDIRAWLDRRVPHGTTASVLLPAALVTDLPETGWSGTQTVMVPQPGETVARRESRENTGRSTSTASAAAPAAAVPRKPAAPAPPKVAGTTSSGLPRRVSHSIKTNSEQPAQQDPPATANAADAAEGHRKLLADLEAFSDGERAAREDGLKRLTDTSPGTSRDKGSDTGTDTSEPSVHRNIPAPGNPGSAPAQACETETEDK